MNVAVLRELHEARPFVPFTISLADGRQFPVRRNEFMAIFPSGNMAMVFYEDDRFTLVDLPMITAVDVGPKYRTRQVRTPAES